MFRGKEIFKQNRIILISSRVIEIWCFGLPAALGRGQVGGGCLGVSGGMGGVPTCTHMHADARTHTHTHTCIELQMAASMEASMFSMFNMHVHACVRARACACVHAWDTPHTPIPTPTPIHPSATPPGGWTPGIT